MSCMSSAQGPNDSPKPTRLRRAAPILALGGVALVAVASAFTFKLQFLLALALATAAVFGNGVLAMLEDDLPGGFNNPNGSATPRYIRYVRIVVWSAVGLLLALVALVFSAKLL